MATLPERLKEIRNHKGYTQQEMANFIGISKSSLNNYEQGIRKPNIEILEQIADVLNYPIEYLIGKYDTINCPICHCTFDPLDEKSTREHEKRHHYAIIKMKFEEEAKKKSELNQYFDIVINVTEQDPEFYNVIRSYMNLSQENKNRFYDYWNLFIKSIKE